MPYFLQEFRVHYHSRETLESRPHPHTLFIYCIFNPIAHLRQITQIISYFQVLSPNFEFISHLSIRATCPCLVYFPCFDHPTISVKTVTAYYIT
jgi:hypothetical protein